MDKSLRNQHLENLRATIIIIIIIIIIVIVIVIIIVIIVITPTMMCVGEKYLFCLLYTILLLTLLDLLTL